MAEETVLATEVPTKEGRIYTLQPRCGSESMTKSLGTSCLAKLFNVLVCNTKKTMKMLYIAPTASGCQLQKERKKKKREKKTLVSPLKATLRNDVELV